MESYIFAVFFYTTEKLLENRLTCIRTEKKVYSTVGEKDHVVVCENPGKVNHTAIKLMFSHNLHTFLTIIWFYKYYMSISIEKCFSCSVCRNVFMTISVVTLRSIFSTKHSLRRRSGNCDPFEQAVAMPCAPSVQSFEM